MRESERWVMLIMHVISNCASSRSEDAAYHRSLDRVIKSLLV